MEQLVKANFIAVTGCHLSGGGRKRQPHTDPAYRTARAEAKIRAGWRREPTWVLSFGRVLQYHVLNESEIRALPPVKQRVMKLCFYAVPIPCEPVQVMD